MLWVLPLATDKALLSWQSSPVAIIPLAFPAALTHLSPVQPGLGQPPSPSQQSQGPVLATTIPHVTGDTRAPTL